ncbi:Predicted oxidoreductase of the aldo/keto reductase family [Oscillibacter sp. PC13]|uniref:aldo/keto reductase n=1 Tax=Oscillibacter sp. PC13 TaxID=1855299 RepID=UPI0008F2CBE4|nr:aldo/keto reductase [Oscillibacter sp. PC13]SFP74433.1 Predicted oxidoreductase of the aldo/keto reductase family [Oscillibacter sp. PC13]
MEMIRLGCTELRVTKTAFGALPIQRISHSDAVKLIRRAYDSGINYFDTANMYTDSEEKLGSALHDVRQNVVISTKSGGQDKKTVQKHIEQSLRMLQTDYIDLFQFHNPADLPDPTDPDGPFAAVLEAKRKGYIRHIGITNHRLPVAKAAIDSGNFETLQFPFCHLASEKDLELVRQCKEKDMGFIAMKGLSGGLLNNAEACYAFIQQYDNVVPIWGIQHEWELDQWLELAARDVHLTPELEKVIAQDRKELAGDFCRSCGYCLPCAADIDIPQSARMSALLRRSPYEKYMSDEWHEKMHRIENCIHCNACKSRCPYGLDTPALLQKQLKDYDEFYAVHHND